jgi:Ca2+-binding EF-hand superfamily protein
LFCPPSDFFMLFDVNGDGLISFREWVVWTYVKNVFNRGQGFKLFIFLTMPLF